MENVYGTAMLCDVNIESNKDLLDLIANKNNELQIEFCIQLCNITDLFKYYVDRHIEHISDIDVYDCIYPEILKDGNEFIFTLNADNDEENFSDINFLQKELKKHFGVSVLRCDLTDILRIILMGSTYTIENDILKLKIYYETYKESWIGDFLRRY